MNANIFFYTDDLHAHHSLDQHPNPNEFYMHTHENFEIYYFISGNAHYTIEGNKYSLQKGDVLITRNIRGISFEYQFRMNVPYDVSLIHFILTYWMAGVFLRFFLLLLIVRLEEIISSLPRIFVTTVMHSI